MASFAVIRLPILNRPRLSAESMQELGDAAELSVRRRISFAVDLGDGPAKPLDEKYKRRKTRAGRKPIRDWRFDGGMMKSVDKIQAAEEFYEFGPSGFEQIKMFRFREPGDHLWGLSGRDRDAIQDELTEITPRIAREVVGRG